MMEAWVQHQARQRERDKDKTAGAMVGFSASAMMMLAVAFSNFPHVCRTYFCRMDVQDHWNKLQVFERGVLVIGQTGAGKSSLINSFILEYDNEASAHQLQDADGSINAVTMMETTEVNVTMRLWDVPDADRPEIRHPMAMLARFYDTRGFMDHHLDAGGIAQTIKTEFSSSGPVMHSLLVVIKVDRMGPLARQLHTLLKSLPRRTGVVMALTHCNHMSDKAIGAAIGSFKNEIIRNLHL